MSNYPSKQEINEFLTSLRESGRINMFGAGEVLEDHFNLTKEQARSELIAWMKINSLQS